MKAKKILGLLIAALTVSTATVLVNASISGGPDTGTYRIANAVNNAVLTTDSRDPSYLTCALGSSTTWNIVEKTTFYLITSVDGKKALEVGDGGYVFLRDTNESNANQQWSILQAPSAGFTIQLKGAETYLGFENNDLKTQGTKPNSTDTNYKNYIWTGSKVTPSATPTPTSTPSTGRPTQTPTPTPNGGRPPQPSTPPARTKLSIPVSDPVNGSVINVGRTIVLSGPSSIPNASVVYSMVNPNNSRNVTWTPFSAPIKASASGTFEFWAKTTAAGGGHYDDSDIVHFVFQVRNTEQPLTQVVLKVTMNKLQYTVNGTPMMFDVAPYLDTKAYRSMIPMRFIAEAFGATVTWDDATKTQTIILNGKKFTLTENKALPDGMGTPVLVKDRFFVPLRYVSQELGASVDWDEATQTNTITYYK